MHGINLRSVDLNLLLVLHALLTERHITRAANRLNMSQPAVSHALGRLRALFGDRILIRCGQEMRLTSRAEEIAGDLEIILTDISHILERPHFDPSEAQGRIAICATEGAITVFADALVAAKAIAKSIVFELSSEQYDIEGRLKSGEVDIYVDTQPMLTSSEFHSIELFRNELMCVMREGSGEDDRMSRADYQSRDHIMIAGGTNDRLSHFFRENGIARNTTVITPGYFSAASIASKSDLLLTLPAALATHVCEMFPLQQRRFGFYLPDVVLTMSWHSRRDNNPLHKWAREMIVAGARTAATALTAQ